MISDEALMADFQRGSRPAFEELFARYQTQLFVFFARRLAGRERAQDLTQETFLAVIRATARYEPRSSVRTYLYGIAIKLLAAEQRKHRPLLIEVEPATVDSSDDVLWVREALARLNDSDREILMLREYEQLSYSEISSLLGLPLNTVRSRLFRSRMALKTQLEPTSGPADIAKHEA